MPGRRPDAAARLAGALLAAAALAPGPARADERWLLQGLADLEAWSTDGNSYVLSRNEDDRASSGRLRLWLAADLFPRTDVVVLGKLEGGNADDESGTTAAIEQAYARAALGSRGRAFVEAGRITTPLGNFSERYLSTQNPLIGEPVGYSGSYPLGLKLYGSAGRFDYQIAAIDEAPVAERFLPEPDSAWRPAVSFGVTPFTGFRVGVYATRGPYLNRALAPWMPAGSGWRDYEQRVAGVDVAFSRGHLEINADFGFNRYEVPTFGEPFDGHVFFTEVKYTWTPRLFTALRVETTEYVGVRPPGTRPDWTAVSWSFDDVEVGVGYRFTRDTLLKLSYRADDWGYVPPALRIYYGEGHAVALQLSQSFDVRSWLRPSR